MLNVGGEKNGKHIRKQVKRIEESEKNDTARSRRQINFIQISYFQI